MISRRFVALGVMPLLAATLLSISTAASTQGQPETPSPSITPTLTQTPIPTLTSTPTPFACDGDEHEPNDGGYGCALPLSIALSPVFGVAGDVDWFMFLGKWGHIYQIDVTPGVGTGVDPILALTTVDGSETLALSDDLAPGNLAAQILYTIPDDGYYGLRVSANGVIVGQYQLEVVEVAPTATATPTPTNTPTLTSTPFPSSTPAPSGTPIPTNTPSSIYEPNDTWEQAKPLTLDKEATDQILTSDWVDWWAIRVKPNTGYTCQATSQDFDPVVRIEQDGQILARNDDVAVGNTDAEVTWYAWYDAVAFPVVEATFGTGAYQITCSVIDGESAGAGGGGGDVPSATPTNSLSSPTPASTSTLPPSTQEVTWELIGPAYVATPMVTTIRVLVYYDLNASSAPEPDEGVKGLSVRALSENRFVGWAITNAQGEATLAVLGPVDRVIIPFLNLQEEVQPGKNHTTAWRLTAVRLPTFLPVADQQEGQ